MNETSVIDQLEAQKAKIEADLKVANHTVWMLKADLTAVNKKLERTKEMIEENSDLAE